MRAVRPGNVSGSGGPGIVGPGACTCGRGYCSRPMTSSIDETCTVITGVNETPRMTSASIDVRWTAMASGARVDLERSRPGEVEPASRMGDVVLPEERVEGGAGSSACRSLAPDIRQLSGESRESIGSAGMRHFLRVIDRSGVHRSRYLAPSRRSRHPEPVMVRSRDVARSDRLVSGSRPPRSPSRKDCQAFYRQGSHGSGYVDRHNNSQKGSFSSRPGVK